MRKYLALLVVFVLTGCTPLVPRNAKKFVSYNEMPLFPLMTPVKPSPDKPVIDCYNADLECTIWETYLDAAARFDNPVLVTCHGSMVGGVWMAMFDWDYDYRPSVEYLAQKYATKYPNSDIVLSICNPEGVELKNCPPRVYYWKSSVPIVPNNSIPFFRALGTDRWPLAFWKGNPSGSIWSAVNTHSPTP